MVQVVEHLPSKCEALSSNPIFPEKRRKKGRGREKEIWVSGRSI
jgi:hypothetical protein